jgi:hypothetical protein
MRIPPSVLRGSKKRIGIARETLSRQIGREQHFCFKRLPRVERTTVAKQEELAGFYFCNGWHRPGGRYAISSLERRKLLQTLSPHASASRTRESPSSSPTNETQESAMLHFRNRESLSFSWHDASKHSEEQFSFSTAQATLHSTHHDASELSEAEMLSLSVALSAVQFSEQDWSTAQSGPSQHDAFELSEAERLSISIASLGVECPEHDMSTPLPILSDDQRTTTASPSSTAQLQQSAQSGQPSLTSSAEGNRKYRPTDVDEECQICIDPLEDPTRSLGASFATMIYI